MSTYYVPDIGVGVGDSAMNKIDNDPLSHGAGILVEQLVNTFMNNFREREGAVEPTKWGGVKAKGVGSLGGWSRWVFWSRTFWS